MAGRWTRVVPGCPGGAILLSGDVALHLTLGKEERWTGDGGVGGVKDGRRAMPRHPTQREEKNALSCLNW